MTCNRPGRQSGLALISVLLVFALVTVIAGEIASRTYRDMRKTANLINSKQAYHYALSGEQFARQILYRDFSEQRDEQRPADGLTDNWALELEVFEIEGGAMSLEIRDLQGLFNLNNLVTRDGTASPVAMEQFRRLQEALGITGDYTAAVVDWMDRDRRSLAGGDAEEAAYGEERLPANRPMADTSELLAVAGMERQDYLKLAPHVAALPKQVGEETVDATAYNLNTADDKLLQALGTSASLAGRQEQGGYNSVQSWLNTPEGAKLNAVSQQLSVTSRFFEVVVKAEYQQRVGMLTTVVHRDPEDGQLTVIQRQTGPATPALTP